MVIVNCEISESFNLLVKYDVFEQLKNNKMYRKSKHSFVKKF